MLSVALFRIYRAVRSVFPPSCRFAPSCSEYAEDAIRLHGWVRGGGLALRRLLRCHPWSEGGWEPVP